MEIDTDLDDTFFADIEKTEMVLVAASRLKRFFNYLIDLFFILTLINNVNLFILGGEDNEFVSRSLWNFNIYYTLIAVFGYYLVLEAMFSTTLGKAITDCFVVGDNAEPIGLNKALARSLCRLIPFEPISMLGQSAWHDSFTKTYVVNSEEEQQISITTD